jgi:hypothetical protein
MIKHRERRIKSIVRIIRSHISEFDRFYRKGPSLYFYEQVIKQRSRYENVQAFLRNKSNVELLYSTLVSWDMNSRGAKLKYFDDFMSNLNTCLPHLVSLDSRFKRSGYSKEAYPLIGIIYMNLDIMDSRGRLVSNSKMMHFLFPGRPMPMDGRHTLKYFFNNSSESIHKYLESIDFSFEIMKRFSRF